MANRKNKNNNIRGSIVKDLFLRIMLTFELRMASTCMAGVPRLKI